MYKHAASQKPVSQERIGSPFITVEFRLRSQKGSGVRLTRYLKEWTTERQARAHWVKVMNKDGVVHAYLCKVNTMDLLEQLGDPSTEDAWVALDTQ